MKRIKYTLILSLSMFFVGNLFSQKQSSGNITTELQLSPLGSEPLKIDGLKFRKFLADNKAIRLNMFLGGKKTPTLSTSNDIELKSISSNFDLTLKPGYEMHFNGSNKLSPYIGSELLIGFNNKINSTQTLWGADNSIETKRVKDHSSVLGLNLFTGTDFYFAEKFYIGVEIGFGFLYNSKGYTSTKYNNPSDPTFTDNKSKGTSSDFTWGPNYQGTFRIGYCIK